MRVAAALLVASALAQAGTLYEKAVTSTLSRFEDWILIDARTGVLIGSRWVHPEQAIPVGSLVKPFTALAWSGDYPVFTCNARECWQPAGHGRVDITHAIGYSCNSYFLQMAAR